MATHRLPLPVPVEDLAPITHAELLRRLRDHAAASRTQYPQVREDGVRDPRHITTGQEKRLISYLSRAMAAAGVPLDSTTCVRVLVPDLAGLATTRAIHADASGAVSKALEITFGYKAKRRAQLPGGTGERLLPVGFRPLLNFVEPADSFASQAANLLTSVARAAHAAGTSDAPARLPTAVDMMRAASDLRGLGATRLTRALSAYRALRSRALAADPSAPFAPLPDGRIERDVGRGLLWVLAQRARNGHERASEYLELVAVGDQRCALRAVLPSLADDLDTYLEAPRGERKELHSGRHLSRTQSDVVDGVCNCAAAILDLGLDAGIEDAVDLEWLWTANHVTTAAAVASNKKMQRRAAARSVTSGHEGVVAVPVSRLVADHMTALSRVLSGNPGSLGYPQTVKHDLWAAWAVTHAVYHDSLNESEPTLWMAIFSAWETLRRRFKKNRAAVPVSRQKKKKRGLLVFPAPHLFAFGLPLLAEEARRALRRAKRFVARNEKLNPDVPWQQDHDANQAMGTFADAALRYLVTALSFWDSLRLANYVHARYGQHVRDVVLPDDTRAICTSWTDDPDDPARTKQGKIREWILPTGAIDLEIWDAYLQYVRTPRLLRRGVSIADATAPNGRFALFVTDAATDTPAAEYSETQISRVWFGGGLLWIARHVFGIDELPEHIHDLDRVHWRGVFSLHFVRDVVATYLGTILGEWAAAEERTLDEQHTLRETYAQSLYAASFKAAGWNLPALEQWARRAFLGSERRALDAFADHTLRDHLPAAAAATLARWRREDADERHAARNTVGSVSGGRTRRRRPGQRPPISASR